MKRRSPAVRSDGTRRLDLLFTDVEWTAIDKWAFDHGLDTSIAIATFACLWAETMGYLERPKAEVQHTYTDAQGREQVEADVQ